MIYCESMKLSIVIPCKNEAGVVEHLLDSILVQTKQPDEIIMVDSHSTDSTVESMKKYQKKLPIHIIAAKAKGSTHAHNEGAAATTGDVILFIDADIVLAPNVIEKVFSQVENGVEAGGFSHRLAAKAVQLRVGARIMNGYTRAMSITPWPIFNGCYFTTKKLFDELGGLDPQLWIMEDYDYAYRARQHGAKVRITNGTYITVSARRFEEGAGHSFFKGAYAEIYRYTHGMRITKPLFTYEMGGKVGKKKG